MAAAARLNFWRRTLRLTAGLLLIWLLANLAMPWFARDLHSHSGFGFPASYWLAAQGMLLLYLLIIVIYVVVIDRLEARYLQDTGPNEPNEPNASHPVNAGPG